MSELPPAVPAATVIVVRDTSRLSVHSVTLQRAARIIHGARVTNLVAHARHEVLLADRGGDLASNAQVKRHRLLDAQCDTLGDSGEFDGAARCGRRADDGRRRGGARTGRRGLRQQRPG